MLQAFGAANQRRFSGAEGLANEGSQMSTETHARCSAGFFGHPRGLGWLFAMEACERFSYYGMRAILLYFIIDTAANGGLGMDKPSGQALVAAYGASVYMLTIVGGLIADRVVGLWRATLYGGVVIMAGHVLLTVPTSALSWVGICCVSVGTGLLKPNVQAMVGALYRHDDPRRDGGFQLLYMSVNIGSFSATLIVGALRAAGGYHAGFAAAAVAMGLSLILFLLGRRRMPASAMQPPQRLDSRQRVIFGFGALGALVLAAAVFLLFLMFVSEPSAAVVGTVAILSAAAAIGYFAVLLRSRSVTQPERRNVRAYLPLWFTALLVSTIEEQASVKMATFSAFHTDLRIGDFSIPPEWYQSINPLVIVLFAPALVALFTRRAGKFPDLSHKFVIGATLTAMAGLLMGLAFDKWPSGGSLAPWWVLAVVFVVQTMGELVLAPAGLAATSLLMPKSFAGQGMAVWLLTNAVAQGLAAMMIQFIDDLSDAGFYYVLTGLTAAVIVALMFYTPSINERVRRIRAPENQALQGDLVKGGSL